jgi:hypothetical protein
MEHLMAHGLNRQHALNAEPLDDIDPFEQHEDLLTEVDLGGPRDSTRLSSQLATTLAQP